MALIGGGGLFFSLFFFLFFFFGRYFGNRKFLQIILDDKDNLTLFVPEKNMGDQTLLVGLPTRNPTGNPTCSFPVLEAEASDLLKYLFIIEVREKTLIL